MKKLFVLFFAITMVLVLAACGASKDASNDNKDKEADKTEENKEAKGASDDGTRVIKHLGEEYTVPAKVDKYVIVGAIEAMEDSMVLGVKPVGANTAGGEFPEIFDEVLKDATPIGEKTEPNVESILQLKPDVILMSTKFPEETKEKLAKLAPVIPISHISEDWKDNLSVLAELTGKEDEAKEALENYEKDLEKAKEELGKVDDKKVLTLRIRRGEIFVYPDNVFLNASLYHDLGFTAPDVIKQAKAQEALPLEKISEVNPDYIFVQFEQSSNTDDTNALEDIQKNPIWKSLKAVKEDKVFVNAIDPILEGGPLYSRELFLKEAVEKLAD